MLHALIQLAVCRWLQWTPCWAGGHADILKQKTSEIRFKFEHFDFFFFFILRWYSPSSQCMLKLPDAVVLLRQAQLIVCFYQLYSYCFCLGASPFLFFNQKLCARTEVHMHTSVYAHNSTWMHTPLLLCVSPCSPVRLPHSTFVVSVPAHRLSTVVLSLFHSVCLSASTYSMHASICVCV